MDDATFGEVNIGSFVSDGDVWVSSKDLVGHLCGVAWDIHNSGYLEDAAAITEIGKWLESCMVNAMVAAVLDVRDIEGAEAAAKVLVNLIDKA